MTCSSITFRLSRSAAIVVSCPSRAPICVFRSHLTVSDLVPLRSDLSPPNAAVISPLFFLSHVTRPVSSSLSFAISSSQRVICVVSRVL